MPHEDTQKYVSVSSSEDSCRYGHIFQFTSSGTSAVPDPTLSCMCGEKTWGEAIKGKIDGEEELR